MGVIKSGQWDRRRIRKVQDVSIIATFTGGVRISRDFLLASASLATLVAVGEPGAAWAGCTPSTQTVSTGVTGPVRANGGNIIVESGGSIGGAPKVFSRKTAASISLRTAARSGPRTALQAAQAALGCGPTRARPSTCSSNAAGATISGGEGGLGLTSSEVGVGGAGVSNAGTVRTLTNSGTIGGGNGGGGSSAERAARASRISARLRL